MNYFRNSFNIKSISAVIIINKKKLTASPIQSKVLGYCNNYNLWEIQKSPLLILNSISCLNFYNYQSLETKLTPKSQLTSGRLMRSSLNNLQNLLFQQYSSSSLPFFFPSYLHPLQLLSLTTSKSSMPLSTKLFSSFLPNSLISSSSFFTRPPSLLQSFIPFPLSSFSFLTKSPKFFPIPPLPFYFSTMSPLSSALPFLNTSSVLKGLKKSVNYK